MGVFFKEASKRQTELNESVVIGELAATARQNAQKSLTAILNGMPEISENYEFVWFN